MSGCWLALALIPWCACMGATIPVAMFAIRRGIRRDSDPTKSKDGTGSGPRPERSFSFLYVANVIGAVAGASIAPALIELYGFHGTLHVAAMLNVVIFVSATALSFALTERLDTTAEAASAKSPAIQVEGGKTALVLLFTTGLTTMGMELIWIRLYTYFVGPLVYSFAKILAVYLAATFAGSTIYRLWSRRARGRESMLLWVSLAFLGLLPLHTANPLREMPDMVRILLGIAPFAAMVGFLSPMLVDRWSGGDPDRAGRAYAVNVLGCIVGPLVAGFVLLPLFGEQVSLLILVLPWFVMAIAGVRQWKFAWQTAATACILIAAILVFHFGQDYETLYPHAVIRRDSTATVIAAGEGMDRKLLVERRWHDGADADHQDDGALHAVASVHAAAQCADHLLRDGHDVSFGSVVGNSGDGGGAGAERARAIYLLPSGRRAVAGVAARACGDRRWPALSRPLVAEV